MRKQRPRPSNGYGLTRLERFDQFWTPEPNTGCWLWIGGDNRGRDKKYGRPYFIWDGRRSLNLRKRVAASRAAYLLYIGEIPVGQVVCHRCDTPACVNPKHLFIGSQFDNTADCEAKNRAVYDGVLVSGDAVKAIRQAFVEFRWKLANEYGVSYACIQDIESERRHRPEMESARAHRVGA